MHIVTRLGDFDLGIWVRLGNCLYNRLQNNPSGALNWADDALNLAQRAGSRYFAAQALIERGQAAMMADDLAGAEQDLQAAIEITTQMDCRYHLARAELLLSAIHQTQGLTQAEDEWQKTVVMIKRGGYSFILERERNLAFPMVASFLKSRRKETRAAAETMIEFLERIAPLPLRVVGLGSFTVWQGRRQIPDSQWSKRKAGELFRFLLLQPNHTAPREVVLDNLWGEHTPTTAHDLFHQATSNLRHTLEPYLPDRFTSRYLSVESERVSLFLPPGSAVDFDQFSKLVPQAIHSGNMDQLHRALSYYPGDLFPQDIYADWTTGPREYLLQIYINGLLALSEGYLRANQYLQALDACQRILQRNAWNEDAVMLGMRACLGLNDIPRAMRLFMDLEKTLHTELQIAPRADLRELVKTLRAQK
jgi:DNA-binding SARP family transcriptional activator